MHVRIHNRGFSFLEVVVVIALLLIMLAISLPLFNNSNSFNQLKADTFDLAGRLNRAKFRATTDLAAYRIRFDFAKNGYILERRNGNNFNGNDTDNDRETGLLIRLRERVSYVPPTAAGSPIPSTIFATTPGDADQRREQSQFIAFNSRGIPVDDMGRPQANNAIYLKDNRNHYFAITVSLAGLVEIWIYRESTGRWELPS